MLDARDKELSLDEQCQALGISLSGYYYKPKGESAENLAIMLLIDKQYTSRPYYGAQRMHAYISSLGYKVNIKRIRRLMRLMGIEAIYCKPNLSKPDKTHKRYPYLLRNVEITDCDQAWSMDITYIPMERGFMYLTAIIDWRSRYILSWRLSNTLEGSFCRECLTEALNGGKPEIFNTDQGVQFTSERFQEILSSAKDVKVSMDGKGRALDNVFIERFWRSLKYEYVYLYAQKDAKELYAGIKEYIDFYNNGRPHQSLGYKTPAEVYSGRSETPATQSVKLAS